MGILTLLIISLLIFPADTFAGPLNAGYPQNLENRGNVHFVYSAVKPAIERYSYFKSVRWAKSDLGIAAYCDVDLPRLSNDLSKLWGRSAEFVIKSCVLSIEIGSDSETKAIVMNIKGNIKAESYVIAQGSKAYEVLMASISNNDCKMGAVIYLAAPKVK